MEVVGLIKSKDKEAKNQYYNHYLNIEWSSTRENCCYRSKNIKNSSDYTGVSFDKSRNQWVAQIRFNNRHNFLGRFKTEKEAYQKRINYALGCDVPKDLSSIDLQGARCSVC